MSVEIKAVLVQKFEDQYVYTCDRCGLVESFERKTHEPYGWNDLQAEHLAKRSLLCPQCSHRAVDP